MKKGAKRGPRGRGAGRIAGGVALALLAAGALVAPTLADGYAALQWTRHYAAGFGSERPQERVREAGHWAARAVDALAPLPAAGEAATLALQTGRRFEGERPAAAQALYAEVRASLERQRASAWRGWGLAALAGEARALDEGVRPGGTAGGAGVAPSAAPSAAASGAPPMAPASPSPTAAPALVSPPPAASPSEAPAAGPPSPQPGSPSPSPHPSASPAPGTSPPAARVSPSPPIEPPSSAKRKPRPSPRRRPRPRPSGARP